MEHGSRPRFREDEPHAFGFGEASSESEADARACGVGVPANEDVCGIERRMAVV